MSIVSCIGHAVVDANYVLISSLIGPIGLKLHRHEGKPIIHAIIENEELSIKHFTMFSLELQCLEIMYAKTKSIYYKMPF